MSQRVARAVGGSPRRRVGTGTIFGALAFVSRSPRVRGMPPKPQAFAFSVDWLKYFLTQNPQLDASTITLAGCDWPAKEIEAWRKRQGN